VAKCTHKGSQLGSENLNIDPVLSALPPYFRSASAILGDKLHDPCSPPGFASWRLSYLASFNFNNPPCAAVRFCRMPAGYGNGSPNTHLLSSLRCGRVPVCPARSSIPYRAHRRADVLPLPPANATRTSLEYLIWVWKSCKQLKVFYPIENVVFFLFISTDFVVFWKLRLMNQQAV